MISPMQQITIFAHVQIITYGRVGTMHIFITYYAGIMHDAFSIYYAQNYAGIIGAGLSFASIKCSYLCYEILQMTG